VVHLGFEGLYFTVQAFGRHRSCTRRFLPVSAIKLMQITINTFFDLIHTALYLGACEVLVAGINGL